MERASFLQEVAPVGQDAHATVGDPTPTYIRKDAQAAVGDPTSTYTRTALTGFDAM